MMTRILVIGCNALELSAQGIRVYRNRGVMPIAWREVTAAALAGKDRQVMRCAEANAAQRGWPAMESAGMLGDLLQEQLEVRRTHDALLIVHRDGIVQALIEKSAPRRDALLAGLRMNLGARWLGEDFTSQELEKRFGPRGSGCSLRPLGCAVALIGAFILVMVGSLLATAVPGATAAALVEALLARDWKAALLAGTILVLLLLGYWVVKTAARYVASIIRGRLT